MPTELPSSDRLRARTVAQATIDAATADLERGAIDEAGWHRRVTNALATAYLSDPDPRWQSGFDGDEELWREARSLILLAVHRDGSFLDVGCANGHLMESLAAWSADRGTRLDLWGLELNSDLAAKARRRLPAHAGQIFEGNVVDWLPPRRFTFVRTGLEYVTPSRRAFLVQRLADLFVEPGGRVIVGPLNAGDLPDTLRIFSEAGVTEPAHADATDRNGKTRHVVWCSAPVG